MATRSVLLLALQTKTFERLQLKHVHPFTVRGSLSECKLFCYDLLKSSFGFYLFSESQNTFFHGNGKVCDN